MMQESEKIKKMMTILNDGTEDFVGYDYREISVDLEDKSDHFRYPNFVQFLGENSLLQNSSTTGRVFHHYNHAIQEILYFKNRYTLGNLSTLKDIPDDDEFYQLLQNEVKSILNITESLHYFFKVFSYESLYSRIKNSVNEWVNLCESLDIEYSENTKVISSALDNLDEMEDIGNIEHEANDMFDSFITFAENLKSPSFNNFVGPIKDYEDFKLKYKEGLITDLYFKLENNYKNISNPNFKNIETIFEKFQIKESMLIIKNELSKLQDKVIYHSKSPILSQSHEALKDLTSTSSRKSYNNGSSNDITDFIQNKKYFGVQQNVAFYITNTEHKSFPNRTPEDISNNNSDIASFIQNKKSIDDLKNVTFYMNTPNNKKYSSFIMFYDNSILTKNSMGEYKLIKDKEEANICVRSIFKSLIDLKLKKHPHMAKIFSDILANNIQDMNIGLTAINSYLENTDILKANKFDILQFKTRSFEVIDDAINKIVKEHKSKQYAHSIASNKYLKLYDKESYLIIKEIEALNISPSLLQDSIGKKIAAFTSPTEFNESLKKLLNSFNQFDPESVLNKASANNVKVASNQNNVIILEIDNYEKSKLLGSGSWCLSRDKHYFDSYTKNNAKQYFIYDFNKDSFDNNSMIGLTLREDGSYYTAHRKNDSHCNNESMKETQLLILKENIKDYPLMNKLLKIQLEYDSIGKKLSNSLKP